MARKAPAEIDPTRRLAAVDPESGATGVVHGGIIYTRGMEAELPDDFPQDGPWWEDYEPDEPHAAPARQHSAQVLTMDEDDDAGPDIQTGPPARGKQRRGAHKR